MNTERGLKVEAKKMLVLKIIVLICFVAYGFGLVIQGYLLTLREPSPEDPILFQKTMHPSAGPHVGTVKIKMSPTQAFVVGDIIKAEVEVDVFGVNWRENETCMVEILFPDAICYIDSWSNITKQDWSFHWWEYQSHNAVYAIYLKNVTLWHVHEGIYGLNISVYQPALREFGWNEFYFPDLVQIKSYAYLEEKRRSNLANALNVEILGLALVVVGPVVVQIVDFIWKLFTREEKETKSCYTGVI